MIRILCCATCGHALISRLSGEGTCRWCGALTASAARMTLRRKAATVWAYQKAAAVVRGLEYTQGDFERDNKDLFG